MDARVKRFYAGRQVNTCAKRCVTQVDFVTAYIMRLIMTYPPINQTIVGYDPSIWTEWGRIADKLYRRVAIEVVVDELMTKPGFRRHSESLELVREVGTFGTPLDTPVAKTARARGKALKDKTAAARQAEYANLLKSVNPEQMATIQEAIRPSIVPLKARVAEARQWLDGGDYGKVDGKDLIKNIRSVCSGIMANEKGYLINLNSHKSIMKLSV